MDYRDVEWFEPVAKGQKLAFYQSAKQGQNGTTIKGRVIPARRGREKGILTGKGFRRLEDGKTYFSDMQGVITLQEEKLNQAISRVNQELYALENAHKDLQRKYKPEIRNTMDLYFKIESAIYTKEKQMETLLSAKDKLEEELKKSCNACAIVNGELFEGVIVEIDGLRWHGKNIMDVTIKRTAQRIAIVSNHYI